jgi:serine phosphatase RsbU (regulator of sigma subunit)
MVPEQQYAPVQAELGPGDLLVLYTDGLTDAGAPRRVVTVDELLEILRGCAGLGLEDVLARLQAEAVGDAEPRDDIALLALLVPND